LPFDFCLLTFASSPLYHLHPMPAVSLKNVLPKRLSSIGSADAGLGLTVILVVGLMIIPLPTWMLDILLATNISLGVAILLVVLFVNDALGIATFPTLLLITTLFRLALNVSSTRLILLQANAGEVISAFGNFVVRGNYVVGAVVFLILTIIQFVVIAKGSERVAEVGARFVLDAMPGKQMAIDAELRSGAIDGNEARRRRRQLARESQFYGSMDGAMKFVKTNVCLCAHHDGGQPAEFARCSPERADRMRGFEVSAGGAVASGGRTPRRPPAGAVGWLFGCRSRRR